MKERYAITRTVTCVMHGMCTVATCSFVQCHLVTTDQVNRALVVCVSEMQDGMHLGQSLLSSLLSN
jgi:hypothetical protein